MSDDPFAQLKAMQREGWALFAPLDTFTTPAAAQLLKHARVRSGQSVLDVGCGTGVVTLTAARAGAKASGLDLSPVLLTRAREHAALAGFQVDYQEGDVEALPYGNAAYDVVLSQFGHMFAPRPEVAIGEMLRVLKPGGTIAFSTWPPEHFVGQMFALVAKYVPPPQGAAPPPQWGDPNVIRQRLGDRVSNLHFDRGLMTLPALSPQHYRRTVEETLAPVAKLVSTLKDQPAQLAAFRDELDGFVARHLEDNTLRQIYLMTRATKN